jgi:ligand-binding sensor domain-containing protein
MHRLFQIVLYLLIVITAFSQPQRVGQWKTFTDMKSIRGMISVGSTIWAATNGGVFVYDTLSHQIKKFTNTDGLSTNDFRCITNEAGKRIWVGGADGFINVYDIQTHTWSTIDANRASDRSQIGIQDLYLKGDTLFVAAIFGVMPFKIHRWEFGDTYASFGFSSSPIVHSVLTHDTTIFVGTNLGLVVASLTAANLSAPTSWTRYSTFPGMSFNAISALTIFNDTLVIATDKGLAYYFHGSIGTVPSTMNTPINAVIVVEGKLTTLRNDGSGLVVESYSSLASISQVVLSNISVQGSALLTESPLWIATTSNGMAHLTNSGWNYSYPNGPYSNFFSSLGVDDNGVLWAASGSNVQLGFYRYNASLDEDSRWKNFISKDYPILRKDGNLFDCYYKVSSGINGSMWISSAGNGIVEVAGDTIRRILNNSTSPSLPGALSKDTAYVVSSGVVIDGEGKIWIANRNERGGHSLLRLDSDTTCTFFDNPYTGWFQSIAIDRNGTKWLASDLPWESIGYGAYFFNENTSNNWGHLTEYEGLKSNIVLCFAVDLEGSLWIGTSQGVTILNDPQYPKQQSSSYPLSGRFVQTIAVDAVNNKWIGTNEGVFVVNSDGTQLLRTYDFISTQGQLLNNDVRSIALDQTRGIAYFGTEKGLSSLSFEAVQTERTYSTLEIQPNPFNLPSEQPLIIRNLVANSTIKILTTSGSVITQFESQGGGRAFWDGRDKNASYVSSGIYFIVAYADNGTQTIVGKVAVVRH